MPIQIIDVANEDGTITQYVIIDHGNDEFTSMTKAFYDAQQALLL